MPRSLGGRLAAAFVALALAIVIAVGGTLFVVLRGLHADATLGSLADVARSVLPQVRQSLGDGQLRGTIEEMRDQLAERNIAVMLVGADGRLRPIGGAPTGSSILGGGEAVGETVRGNVVLDGERYLYVATVLRRNAAIAPKAIAFVALDRSGGFALADLLRTIPFVIIAMLLVAAPLALLVSRSVTRPLQRVAEAASQVPAGVPVALPLQGPAEVRELTGTFNAMASELDATRRREAELLANLRHDLRTPLTVIAGFAAALRDGTATGKSATAAARAIEEEAARLDRLVQELGSVERLQSGEAGLRPEIIDARELVAGTVGRFGARASAAGISLTAADSGDAPLSLVADRLALERMLGNLVENALEAVSTTADATAPGAALTPRARSSPDAPSSRIVVEARSDRLPNGVDAIRFDVLDDGPGFPAGTAARAFERFWRGDPSRTGAGSGLGLSIVRELALAHGGTVHAENRSPHGARVGVVLPRLPRPSPNRPNDPL
jgi:signal transduction histidine kinase